MKLTKNTSLKVIQAMVLDDFDIEITKEQAKFIRDAHRKGCVTWTPEHLFVSTLNDRLRITPGRID